MTIDELVRGVNIALGSVALAECPGFDTNASGSVDIDELIAAVNAALAGCPGAGSPTPTMTTLGATGTPTAPPAVTATSLPASTPTSTATPTGGPPPDPSGIAPELDAGTVSDVGGSTSFLYDPPPGQPAIQTGVDSEAIERRRAAVARGRVLDGNDAPLAEVRVRVLDHPEFGQTLSRIDGAYDLALNGGGPVTLVYERAGFLPAHRQVRVPWQDYVVVDDVMLLPVDSRVTEVEVGAGAPAQVAAGSMSVDVDGARRGIVLIPPGTEAMMEMPGGEMRAVDSLSLRITEYTVGENGPKQMPAPLPPNSGYTYAFALTADEALASGAEVHLSGKLPYYVDNFLGFPVGTIAPLGGLDPQTGRWVPVDSGRVIRITAVNGGLAEIDSDGDGSADDLLGLGAGERQQLGSLYSAGAELWRVVLGFDAPTLAASASIHGRRPRSVAPPSGVDAFRAWDINWGFGPPEDAEPPMVPTPEVETPLDDPCLKQGSIIECQNQYLGESLAIVGASMGLHYSSANAPGANPPIVVTASGPDPLPASLGRIEVSMSVAGRKLERTLPPAPSQKVTFQWDRRDAYGRSVEGAQKAEFEIAYIYPGVMMETERFAYNGNGTVIEGVPSRQEVRLVQRFSRLIPARDARGQGLGGWTLTRHHRYDPLGQVLYLGDGTRRSEINTLGPVLEESIPTFGDPYNLDVGPDGSLYYLSGEILFRRNPDGSIDTLTYGCPPGEIVYVGQLPNVSTCGTRGMAIGPDGSIYLGDALGERHVIRRIDPTGNVTEIAGIRGSAGFTSDGEFALGNRLGFSDFTLFDVGPDGNLYFAETRNRLVRRIDADGRLSTVAGNGQPCINVPAPKHCLDYSGVPATSVSLESFVGIQVAEDGSVIIAHGWDSNEHVISRVTPDGILRPFIGSGARTRNFFVDGGDPDREYAAYPINFALAPDGNLYFGTLAFHGIHAYHLLRQYRAEDGRIYTYAGVPGLAPHPESPDGGPARGGVIRLPATVAVDPSNRVCFRGEFKIRCVGSSLPRFDASNHLIASDDGSMLYRFDLGGRHLETLHALTNEVLERFEYDANGLLVRIVERTGGTDDVTTIERDGNGNAVAIVAPYGQRTQVTIDASGWLSSVTNPSGETIGLNHTALGLMTSMTTPRGHDFTFTYDAAGRLLREDDPAGGSQSLERENLEDESGHRVTLATGLGRETVYEVSQPRGGQRIERTQAPDGTAITATFTSDGQMVIDLPDGSQATETGGPDPRFGMQSSLQQSATLRMPSMLRQVIAQARSASLADPNDNQSLITLTETNSLNNRTDLTTYDAASRTYTMTTPAGRESTVTLDALGRMVRVQVGSLAPRTNAYDDRGRLSEVIVGTGPGARTLRYAYDEAGYVAAITDTLDRTVSFSRDAAGRVTARTSPDGRTTQINYDANGNATSVTPPGRPAHGFSYTSVDLEAAYTAPDIGLVNHTAEMSYDIDRQPVTTTFADGRTVTAGYDDAGRRQSLAFSRGTIGIAYNEAGQVESIAAPGGIVHTYSYDGSLLLSDAVTGPVPGVVSWTYDSDFRVASQSVNGSHTVAFEYDADSLLTRAGDIEFTYDPVNGLLTQASIGNIVEEWQHNSFGEPTLHTARIGSTVLYSLALSYDAIGRIVRKVESIAGASTTYDYGYDLAGRLATVTTGGAPSATYTYDSNSNRLTRSAGASTETSTYDAQDRLIGKQLIPSNVNRTYGYNAHGQLATITSNGQSTQYDYDEFANLALIDRPAGPDIAYLVDGLHRRVGTRLDGAVVQGFLYESALRIAAELDSAGQVVSRFVYGLRPNVPDYFRHDTGNTYRIVTDHLGSPRLVVNVDTGGVAQRMRHDEFGRVIEDTSPGFTPFGFAGGLVDVNHGFVRFGARDYDPAEGRWTSKDPMRFAGGDTNLYGYAASDPISMIDIEGRRPERSSDLWQGPIQPSTQTCDVPVARVLQIKATNFFGPPRPARVEYQRPGDSKWYTAYLDMPVGVGYVFRTDDNSVAAIEFAIGGRVGINRNSLVTILDEGSADGRRCRNIKIKQGGIWAKCAKLQDPLLIQTNGGVMGIKG